MKYILSKHASEQIKRRNIPINEIEEVIRKPEQVLHKDDYTIYQSIMTKDSNKKYLLRIFVKAKMKPVTIITAYKTSKIEKYYES